MTDQARGDAIPLTGAHGRLSVGARLHRGLAGACALVVALCMTHQLLMTTEQHAAAMGALRGHAAFASVETAARVILN